MRVVHEVVPLPEFDPVVGRALWALEEVRRRTVRVAGGLDQETLDWRGPGGDENSIGSLLYHVALVEISWLYLDILESEIPAAVRKDFPFAMSDPAGNLTHVPSISATEHLDRLQRSRHGFLAELRNLSLDDWTRLRSPVDVEYEATPEWVVFHLVEHEAGHAFQASGLRSRAGRYLRRHVS